MSRRRVSAERLRWKRLDCRRWTPLRRPEWSDDQQRAGVVAAGIGRGQPEPAGLQPLEAFTGRAPWKRPGIALGPGTGRSRPGDDRRSNDAISPPGIFQRQAAALLRTLQEQTDSERLQYFPGVSYRNLLVYRRAAGPFSIDTRTAPHDLIDKSVKTTIRVARKRFAEPMIIDSVPVFAEHPVNVARRGKLRTNIWLWDRQHPKLPCSPSLWETGA